MARSMPGWLSPPILGAACITMFAGAAQFGVTAALGDVAVAFGVVTSGQVDDPGSMTAGTLGLGLSVIRFAGIGALFGAVVADRVGRRRTLLACSALGLAITALATTMPTFWTFVVVIAMGRPLLTTTNAVVPVVAAEEATTEHRTAALAFMSAAYAAGAGVVSVARSVGDGIGYRPLLLGAGAMVLLLPLVARVVRDSPASLEVDDADRPTFGLVDRQHARPLVILCALALVSNLVTGPALTWLFVYGEQVLGASAGTMARTVLLAGPVGLGGLLAGRWAGDRVGRRLTSAIGTAAVPLSAVIAYGSGVGGLQGGYLATVFALGFLGPPVAALLNEVMPTDTRATANGWVGAAAVVGGVIGLTTFGLLIDALPTYRLAAMTLFLPSIPFAFGYLLLPAEADPDIAEVDRLLDAEHGVHPADAPAATVDPATG